MTKKQLEEWMDIGLELEFEYKDKQYYIGPVWNEKDEKLICFYEFYNDSLKENDVDAIWNSIYKGINVGELLSIVPESEIDGLVS